MIWINKLFATSKLVHFFFSLIFFYLPVINTQQDDAGGYRLVEDGEVLNFSLLNYDVNTAAGRVIDVIVDISPVSEIVVIITNIPSSSSFILLQSHSYMYDITLSFDKIRIQGAYINGTNIGLVKETNGLTNVTFYLQNGGNDIVSVLVAIQDYGFDAPIPGGCNMEFPVETAPFLELHYTSSLVTVSGQPPRPSTDESCEFHTPVDLLMFHRHLPERDFSKATYFEALRAMMTVRGMQENAIEVSASVVGSMLRRFYSAYSGTGSVFGAVAVSGFSASAYVPTITYACNNAQGTCDVLTTIFAKVLCAVILFLGLFICFFGHKFFKTEMFIIGSLAGGLVSYIMLMLFSDLDVKVTETFSVIVGILIGLSWFLLWWFFGIPIISVMLPALTLGFIGAATVMYAGLADVAVLENDANFWLTFLCLTLLVPLVATASAHKASMVTCSVLGAYAFIIPVDHYVGSNLKYIIVNIIRRATVPDFDKAVIDPPFQIPDISLLATWLLLAVTGYIMQWYQQQQKPPFPPCPYKLWRGRRNQRTPERTPLLIDARIPYGSVLQSDVAPVRNFPFLPKMPTSSGSED